MSSISNVAISKDRENMLVLKINRLHLNSVFCKDSFQVSMSSSNCI